MSKDSSDYPGASPKPAATEAASITIAGVSGDVHQSPDKIQRLLDLLEVPRGTTVKITTEASSVIVR